MGDDRPRTIVGVVRDIHYGRADAPPVAEVYVVAGAARGLRAPTWYLRTTSGADSLAGRIGEVARRIDPGFVVFDTVTVDQRRLENVADGRLYATIGGIFGATALGLALIGLYNLVSFTVTARLPEFGVRLALGASPSSVGWLALKESLAAMGMGVVLGWVLSLGTSGLLAAALFQIRPGSLVALIGASGVLAATGALATCVPVRRALRLSPSVVMRAQ
jgi:ABC-type antimicrobial peptide transport system permease subunit